jgi:predicted nuclease with RNAse H fold
MRKFGGVLPLTFQGMKTLTFRGIEIKKLINQIYGGSEKFSRDFNSSKSDISKIAGMDIIETHPRTSQRVFGFSENINKFFRITHELFQLNNDLKDATVHEIDALFAAFSGLFYSQGKYLEVGNPEEGSIIVPKLDNKFRQELIKIMKLN